MPKKLLLSLKCPVNKVSRSSTFLKLKHKRYYTDNVYPPKITCTNGTKCFILDGIRLLFVYY